MENNIIATRIIAETERKEVMFAASEYNGGMHYGACFHYGMNGVFTILAQEHIDRIYIITSAEEAAEKSMENDIRAFAENRYVQRCLNKVEQVLDADRINAVKQIVDKVIDCYHNENNLGKGEAFKAFFEAYDRYKLLSDLLGTDFTIDKSFNHQQLSYFGLLLYKELPSRAKMTCRDDNRNVEVVFFNKEKDRGLLIDALGQRISNALAPKNDDDIVNVWEYEAMINPAENANASAFIKVLEYQNKWIRKKKIYSIDVESSSVAIADRTDAFYIDKICDAMCVFTEYGKVNKLLDCLNDKKIKNKTIQSMIYAMSIVDDGVSLCDIDDIIDGIQRLKKIVKSNPTFDDEQEEIFYNIMVFSIINSYGGIMDGEEIDPFELAKWASNRGMYQQALTIIEAKIPDDMVKRGIYYYFDEETDEADLTEKYAVEYSKLKSYEKWKMDDFDHYYVKTYSRGLKENKRLSGHPTEKEKQYANAQFSVSLLNPENDELIKAYTKCTSTEDLTNAFFAYNYLAIVRNHTNHAETSKKSDIDMSLDESKRTEKMQDVTESLSYFYNAYQIVRDQVKDADYTKRELSRDAVVKRGNELRDEYNKQK